MEAKTKSGSFWTENCGPTTQQNYYFFDAAPKLGRVNLDELTDRQAINFNFKKVSYLWSDWNLPNGQTEVI